MYYYIVSYMSETTIQIDKTTRERLSSLKSSPRETYDEILNKLIDLIPSGDDEGEYTDEFKASLFKSLLDIKHGRVYSHEEMKKALGIRK